MAYFTIIAVSMGLQQLKGWMDSKHKKELEAKQREMKRAYKKREYERLLRLQEEAARISAQMEAEAHAQRRKDIEKGYDDAYKSLVEQLQLNTWPLNVVPFIMKGESFGTHVRGFDVACIHCLFTPSNNTDFNRLVYDRIDTRLENRMNRYWNSDTDHQVVYYGGAWKQRSLGGVPVFDYKDVEKLHTGLPSVPFLCITPFFDSRGQLYFRVWAWGMGDTHTTAQDIKPKAEDFSFALEASTFKSSGNDPAARQNLLDRCVSELSDFLTLAAGYLTDMYYWKMYALTPVFPSISASLPKSSNVSDYLDEKAINNEQADISTTLKYGVSLLEACNPDEKEEVKNSVAVAIGEKIGLATGTVNSITDLQTKGDLMLLLPDADKALLEMYYGNGSSAPALEPKPLLGLNKPSNNIKMNAQQYTQNRDSLLNLLGDILKIKSLPNEHRNNFENISRKIREDQFSVALIGEFQGGKSTTVDALCNGREISPRGNNIKTSACRIRVTNISDDAKEHAFVTWKSDTELIQTINSVLKGVPPEELGYNPKTKDVFTYSEYLKLDKAEHRAKVEKALTELSKGVNIDEGTKDVIMIARFILHFYDRTKQYRKNKECSIEEATDFMTFPKDMKVRYDNAKGSVSGFGEKEALFAFVQTVDCYIHSKALERLGCSVIDCPGLFASDYDTSIAIQTLDSSDATLYLLGGDKMMGQDDCRSVREIMNIGRTGNHKYSGENIFFAINQRKSDEQTSFVELDLNNLKDVGYGVQKLPLYNAYLYYYAEIGRAYLNNTLDRRTLDSFMSKARPEQKTFEDKWVNDITRALVTLELDYDYKVSSLSKESVDMVLKLSKASELFKTIEDYVVGTRSYSILVDNGATKVEAGLSAIEVGLREKEKDAQDDLAAKARELQLAKEAYEKFCGEVRQLLKNAFPENRIKMYLSDTYADYFLDNKVIEQMSFNMTVDIIDYKNKWSTKWTGIKKLAGSNKATERIKADITPMLSDAFRSCVDPVVTKWVTALYAGKEDRFNCTIREDARKLAKIIQQKWMKLSSEFPLIREMSLPEIEDGMPQYVKSNVSFSTDDVSSHIVELTSSMAMDDAMREVLAQLVSYITGVVVVLLVDMFFTMGIGILAGVLSQVATYFGMRSKREYNSPADLKGRDELSLYSNLQNVLRTTLSMPKVKQPVCFGEDGHGGMTIVVNNVIEGYKDFYKCQLRVKADELASIIAEKVNRYKKSKAELEKIAKEAKEVREKQISPLRQKVQQFIAKVNNDR